MKQGFRPAFLNCLLSAVVCSAWGAEFQIDPERSTVTLSGNLAGFTIQEQGAGSLTSKLEGTVAVTADGTTIEFLSGPVVTVQDNGSWEPQVGGAPGKAPADFAGKASGFLISAVAAIRDLEIGLTSAPLPLTAGEFAAQQICFEFLGASAFDYRVTSILPAADRLPLTGLATNLTLLPGSLVTEGNVQTLTIPLDTRYRFKLLQDDDSEVIMKGQLVATRPLDAPLKDYDQYIATQFPGESDPQIIGPNADPEGDGVPNFVEFAFGLNATQPEEHFAPLIAHRFGAQGIEISYERPRDLVGVRYLPGSSTDLDSWTELVEGWEVEPLGDDRERVYTRFDLSAPGNDAPRFFKLEVGSEP
jgi:hypothetical protein